MALKKSDLRIFWEQHRSKYNTSGLTRTAYCREHGLKLHQLAYHLRQAGKADRGQKSGFAKIIVKSLPQVSVRACARLIIGGGVMEFDPGIDPTWVARLISAVGRQA